jgi:hypothetical protein
MWPDASHELSAVLRPEEATDIVHPLLKRITRHRHDNACVLTRT